MCVISARVDALLKATSPFRLTDLKEAYVMEPHSENILKALLLLLQKINDLNSTISRIESLLGEVVSPKQEENN